jgi:REP element-mobilizing transposase RayT
MPGADVVHHIMSGRMQTSKQRPMSWMDRGSRRAGFKPALAQQTTTIRWQRGYYERVIRYEKALDRIRAYIADNPARWAHDPENISRSVSAEAARV